jgi:hypothetical protein
MAYPPFADDRRSRRRRIILTLVAVGMVLTVVALAVRYRTERRESVDYLALADEVAGEHADIAAALDDLFATLSEMDRPTVLQRVTMLSDEAVELKHEVEDAAVPRAVAAVHGTLLVAVSAWSDALDDLGDAMVSVLDAAPDDPVGEDALDAVFDDLRLGDEAYALFLDAIDRLDPELVTVEFPPVAYAPGGDEVLNGQAFSEHIRRLRLLSEDRDVAVSLKVDPEPASETGGVSVVPASGDFVVTAVVSNPGNVSIEQISVKFTLSETSSSAEPYVENRAFPALSAGESTSAVFSEVPIEAGTVYELKVEVSLAEPDVNTDNNSARLVFQRNPE